MADSTQSLANVQAAQVASQVANWAAQLEFQKERMRLLELPEMQGKTQIEIDKLAFAKSTDAWQKAIQEASMTGTYQGQPTAQWLQQQAQLTGVLNGNQTLQGKLNDAQIAQMNQAMATQGRQIALDEAKFQDDKERFGLTFAHQQMMDAAKNRQTEAGLTGYLGGQTTLDRDKFTADATGYVNGKATLARDQMNNQQAQQYLQLLSSLQGSPFKTMRVLGNTPNGLADLVNGWAGQYAMGGLTGSGQAPGAPQFADLFNPMGQSGFTGTSPVPPGTPPGVTPVAPLPGGPGGPVSPLTPQEQARFQQLIARQQQLQAAGEPVPPADADELARFMARGATSGPSGQPAPVAPAPPAPVAPGQPTPAPGSYLSPQELTRYQQLAARAQQLTAAGEPIPPADAAEQAGYEARGARPPGQGPVPPGLDPSLGVPPTPINEPTTPGPQPLSAQEQARYEQIIARQRQLAAAGQPLPPEDRAEAASYEARLGVDPGQQVHIMGQPQTGPMGGPGGFMVQQPDGSWAQGSSQAYGGATPPTMQSMAGYGITPASAPGYTYSPPGSQAPANAWNYQMTPSGGTQTYPPGVTAPIGDHQVSTQQAQAMSTAGNMTAAATPGYQSGLDNLTPLSPNQINAKNYGNTNKVGQDLMWQYFEDQQGYAPGAAQDAFMKSLPRYGGPAKGRVTAGLGF